MKRKLGIILIILGIGLLASALALCLQNRQEQRRATEASREVLVKVEAAIRAQTESEADAAPSCPTEPSIAALEIDGREYIGVLEIPSLELELPVMVNWTYPQLRISPCRYSGNASSDDLVIMAHNYSGHFGRLKDMHEGDAVTFTDMQGNTIKYRVAVLEILEPSSVEDVTSGAYDLTLFTCTYGGENRVVLRCDRAAG